MKSRVRRAEFHGLAAWAAEVGQSTLYFREWHEAMEYAQDAVCIECAPSKYTHTNSSGEDV